MIKIGRYGIAFGRFLWFQTQVPTRVRHFLWFWFFREARPQDIDKKRRFPPNTRMDYEGRVYRYWKADTDLQPGEKVGEKDVAKVWELLGLSHDDYMMLYWDFSSEKVMAIDHLGHHSPVGDIYDVVTKDGHIVSFRIREATHRG